jgi:hypothetical protein
MDTLLFVPLMAAPKPNPANVLEGGMSEKEKIRKETEYERARAITDGVLNLAYIGAVIGVAVAVAAIIGDNMVAGIAIASATVSGLISVMLARETMQAIFDIADCALLKNRSF